MAGTKTSGRRPKNYDRLTVQDVLRSSIFIIHKYLKDPDITLQNKAEIAAKFAVKAIPERVLFDEVKKLSFEERMKLIHEFGKLMEQRATRMDEKADLERRKALIAADDAAAAQAVEEVAHDISNPALEVPMEVIDEGDSPSVPGA